MPNPKVEWIQKKNSKEEDRIKISHKSFGDVNIIARHFWMIAQKGVSLLKANNHGTFVDDPDAYSFHIKRCRDPKDMYIVTVYFHDFDVLTVYCDRITKWSKNVYDLKMRGESICMLHTNHVTMSEEVQREMVK